MDRFIVSARKYRPQTFDTVVGQDHITTTLRNAIRNQQLAHAFLFCGPRGVGKTTCARILAKTINCEQPTPEGEACNVCNSCVAFHEGVSLNIHELDAASNNSVEDVRSLVEQVRFSPQSGKYKVYIIDEVHMLSASAFNAFLKTLEEPPPYAIFILATTEKHKILPTILSRCQIFDFRRITTEDTVRHLEQIVKKEGIRAERAALQVIARKSEGCMRDALSMLDKIVSFTEGELTYAESLEHLNILDASFYFDLLDRMLEQDLAGAMLLFDESMQKGFDEELVLNGMTEFFRNLLFCKDAKIAGLVDTVDQFRERFPATAARLEPGYLLSALHILNEAEIQYKAARNRRLHLELVLIRLTYLMQAITLTQSGAALEKKKIIADPGPVAFRAIRPIQVSRASGKAAPAELRPVSPSEGEETGTTSSSPPHPELRQRSGSAVHADVQAKQKAADPATQEEPPQGASAKPSKAAAGAQPSAALLESLRREIASRKERSQQAALPLEPQKLQEAWTSFTGQLRNAKSPAVPSFERASLYIREENGFEIVTQNNLEQRFIEQERGPLSDFLQEVFRNRTLHFSITVTDQPQVEEPGEKPLSKKDQYLLIAGKYPLVQELKDRLRLELDY